MSTCEFHSSCTFYNLLKNKGALSLEFIKEEYCDTRYAQCARHMVSKVKGPGNVSKYLFPEDIHEACKLLDELNY